jgi:hypothetical protein
MSMFGKKQQEGNQKKQTNTVRSWKQCMCLSAVRLVRFHEYSLSTTIKGPLTNQMRLIYLIIQSDTFDLADYPIRCVSSQ